MKRLNLTPRLLRIGLSEQYVAVTKDPLVEDFLCKPLNPYGLSKQNQEDISLMLGHIYNMEVVSTRSFNHIGIT